MGLKKEGSMRTLLKVEMEDVQAANDLIIKGELQNVFRDVSSIIKPETSFFYSDEGCRACCFIFDMKDTAEIPRIAEIFFIRLNAKVFFYPVMNPEELSRGFEMWTRDNQG